MRFALSAVAVASGLALLGLAMFGQPDAYLRQAREQWDSLIDVAPPEVAPDQDGDPRSAAMADKVAQLQQQLAQLRDELAANRAEADQARQALAVARAQRQAEDAQWRTDQASQPAEGAAQPAPDASGPVAEVPPAAAPVPLQGQPAAPGRGPQIQAATPPQPPAAAPPSVLAQSQVPAAAPQPPAAAQGQTVAPPQTSVAVQPQPSAAVAPQTAGRRDTTGSERRQALADRHEAATAERRDPAARASPPRRPETEDTLSVLARLRQTGPTAPPADQAQPPTDQAQPPAERPVHAPSPWLRRLFAARSALAAGQIEEARRLLQQVQLQLVFRPIGTADGSAAASRAAQDVARALDAMSGNDMVQSRNYIDRAMGDSASGPGDTAGRDGASPKSGYAPAYPPY